MSETPIPPDPPSDVPTPPPLPPHAFPTPPPLPPHAFPAPPPPPPPHAPAPPAPPAPPPLAPPPLAPPAPPETPLAASPPSTTAPSEERVPSGPGSPLRRSWRWWTIGVLVVLVGLAVAFGPRLEPEGTATADGAPTTASPTTGAPTTVPNGTDSTGEPAELYPCAPASPQELAAIEATLYGGATFESAAAYRAGAFSWVVGNLRSPSGGPIAGDLAWIVVDGRVGTLSPDAASFSEAPAAIDVFLDLPPDAQEVAHALYDCLR